jgi:hypothetical protein
MWVAFHEEIYEYEFMFNIDTRLLLYGIGLWLAGTISLRLFGERLLHLHQSISTLILFAASFAVMAWLVRRLCTGFHLKREQWPMGAISLALPTLLLDPFSSAFFPAIFPNMAPEAAGVFGGWMLCCCAGAMAGAIFKR